MSSATGAVSEFKVFDDSEPILKSDESRLVLDPENLVYPHLFALANKHVGILWTVDEVDITKDEWDTLDGDAQRFLSQVLAFFACADGIVSENINSNFAAEIQVQEIRFFYAVQNMIEFEHARTYSHLLNSLIKDEAERRRLFNAVREDGAVRAKAQWALKWMNADTHSLAERLVAFAAVEGIFFAASFCAIFWVKFQNATFKLPGLCFSNDYISRDENLHCQFACEVYKVLKHRLPQERVHAIIHEAVECEKQFVTESVSTDMVHINPASMVQHVQFMADFLLRQLGYAPLYGVAEPFEWFHLISASGKDNFFERRSAEYQKPPGHGGRRVQLATTYVVDNDF